MISCEALKCATIDPDGLDKFLRVQAKILSSESAARLLSLSNVLDESVEQTLSDRAVYRDEEWPELSVAPCLRTIHDFTDGDEVALRQPERTSSWVKAPVIAVDSASDRVIVGLAAGIQAYVSPTYPGLYSGHDFDVITRSPHTGIGRSGTRTNLKASLDLQDFIVDPALTPEVRDKVAKENHSVASMVLRMHDRRFTVQQSSFLNYRHSRSQKSLLYPQCIVK